MRNTVIKDIPMSIKNAALDKCRASIMELMGQQAGKDWFKAVTEQAKIDYKVQYLTEHFTGPRDLSVTGGGDKGKAAAAPQQQGTTVNKLPLEVRRAYTHSHRLTSWDTKSTLTHVHTTPPQAGRVHTRMFRHALTFVMRASNAYMQTHIQILLNRAQSDCAQQHERDKYVCNTRTRCC